MDKKVVIIGAGLAGLIAAYELEKKGFEPIMIDADDRVGGRLKTDVIDGFYLDRGFQVLLTAYPEVNRYLDVDKLDLKEFLPGAQIHSTDKTFVSIDPNRSKGEYLKAAFSPLGTVKDKLLVLQLNKEIEKTSIDAIFNEPSITTLKYLQDFGFSNRIISQFFKPFFGGIFLENQLSTSARMFKFIYKMFAEGLAALPAAGIEAIPKQLKEKLSKTKFILNNTVQQVEANNVYLMNGQVVEFDKLIIACEPSKIINDIIGGNQWQQTTNYYYYSKTPIEGKALIGLNASGKGYINNYCILSNTNRACSPSNHSLISVSTNQSSFSHDEDIIHNELATLAGVHHDELVFLKKYGIKQALPVINDVQYSIEPNAVKLRDHIYLAGDYLLMGSLNAAMISGRIAAEAVVADF